MTPPISGTTTVVGIIGWPVDRSISPAVHNAAFEALDLDWAYVPLPVPPGGLASAIPGMAALGLAGANVTMPHKEEAAGLVDSRSELAERLGAVNTVIAAPGGLRGENTDGPGFARFVTDDAGFDATGGTALVLGAGGAARACAWALADLGAGRVVVAAREPERARPAVDRALEGLGAEAAVIGFPEARTVTADVVVNATPLGAGGERLPHPDLRPGMLVVDLLYLPRATPFEEDARQAGAAAFGGVGLLLHQAALAFTLWTGLEPPMEVMSAAAMRALAVR
jgi:shikimate dehydrogenase